MAAVEPDLDGRMSWTYDIVVARSAGGTSGQSRGELRRADERGAVRADHSAQLERLAYTVEEAATVVGVGRDLLYDEIRTGRLRSKKAGSRRVIARHHLLEWLDGNAGKSDARAI